jgi:hypothetical protein
MFAASGMGFYPDRRLDTSALPVATNLRVFHFVLLVEK